MDNRTLTKNMIKYIIYSIKYKLFSNKVQTQNNYLYKPHKFFKRKYIKEINMISAINIIIIYYIFFIIFI